MTQTEEDGSEAKDVSPRKRHRGRELALRLLFQIDVGKIPPAEALALALEASHYDAETTQFAQALLEGALTNAKEIDRIIAAFAHEWTLSRIANVDRNILRLALYELLHRPDIPASVTIDEAVELAKRYSTGESGRFVNGILGNVVRHVQGEEAGDSRQETANSKQEEQRR